MPEGDSLHRAALRLQPLVGRQISASSPHPRGEATGVARAVDGRQLESVEAVGKHLLLRFEGGVTVRSHLRMDEAQRVLERLDRIEELDRANAGPEELLAELRGLLEDAEAWVRTEGGDAADEAVIRLRDSLTRDAVPA